MKIFRFAILLVATLGLSASMALAQSDKDPNVCPDPCSGLQWIYGNQVVTFTDIHTGQTCTETIGYRYSTGCGYSNVEITDLRQQPGCFLQSVDVGMLYQQAIDYLLRANPMGFPPFGAPGTCEWSIRSYMASCVHRVTDPSTGIVSYLPCDGVVCCRRQYKICIDNNGQRTWTLVEGTTSCNDIACAPGCESTGGDPPVKEGTTGSGGGSLSHIVPIMPTPDLRSASIDH
jgi:hypothetical protein